MVMKILHVCPYMHPAAGGPPVVVRRYVENSQNLGVQSSIITTSLFCQGDEEALIREYLEICRFNLLNIKKLPVFGSSADRQVIEQGVKNHDLVHVHTLWHPFGHMVRKACLRFDRPYVSMPHGMLDPYSMGVKWIRKRVYWYLIEKKNMNCAQRVVFTTEEERVLAQQSVGRLPQSFIAPLGSDLPSSSGLDGFVSAFLERFPQTKGKRVVLFLSRMHHKKGIDRLLAILPALVNAYPDVMLLMVGDGEPDYVQEVTRTAGNMQLHDHILFTGRLEGYEKWGAYAIAEMFLLPSRQENFALVIGEAMAMGLPVITTRRVNSWSYITDNRAGRVLEEPFSHDEFLAAVCKLLDNPMDAKEMGKRGCHFARKYLNWPRATQDIVRCYSEILGFKG